MELDYTATHSGLEDTGNMFKVPTNIEKPTRW